MQIESSASRAVFQTAAKRALRSLILELFVNVVLPLVIGSVITAWSMLALLGSEHERRTREIASTPKPKGSDNPAPAQQSSKPPAASGVVR